MTTHELPGYTRSKGSSTLKGKLFENTLHKRVPEWKPASPEEACQRIRHHDTPVSGPPVLLITLYDGQMNISMRYLYSALAGAGHLARVIRFGHTVPYDHDLDYSVFQTMLVKFPLARPPLEEAEVQMLLEYVRREQPCWIGFNVIAPHNHVARRLTERLRAVTNAPIVWGGYMAINEPDYCIQYADVVCTGEGEKTVVELTNAVKHGSCDFSEIRGIWYKKADGEVVKATGRPLMTADELQELELIFFERTEDEVLIPPNSLEYYDSWPKAVGGRANSATICHDVLFTRGCFFTCSFCFHNVQIGRDRGKGKYYRPPAPEWVIEYLKDAKHRLNKKRVLFWEDIFPFDTDWLREFSRLYKKEIGLPFTCNFHPKMIKRENVELLVEAGLDSCNIGFQTGSARVRQNVYGRHETNEEILENARYMNPKVGVCYDMIIDNPYETADDLRESFNLFVQFPPKFLVDTNTLLYFRNQEITSRAIRDGMIGEDQILGHADVRDTQDVTCRSVLPRTDPQKRALTMLVVATQYQFIPRDMLRRWSEDPVLLANDHLMALNILQELYKESRRRMFEYEYQMMKFYKELHPEIVIGA